MYKSTHFDQLKLWHELKLAFIGIMRRLCAVPPPWITKKKKRASACAYSIESQFDFQLNLNIHNHYSIISFFLFKPMLSNAHIYKARGVLAIFGV